MFNFSLLISRKGYKVRSVTQTKKLFNTKSSFTFYQQSFQNFSSMSNITKAYYIDTHTHLDYTLEKLKKDPTFGALKEEFLKPLILKEANGSEIECIFEKCVTVCCDIESFEPTDLFIEHNEEVFAAYGLHPHNAKDYTDEIHSKIIERMKLPKTVAWGEIGLDYHYNMSLPEIQLQVFERQLRAAIEVGKPLVIHTREAEEDTIRLLKEIVPVDWKVHVHCFTSSVEMAVTLVDHFSNLFIGLTGVVTFKNSKDVQEVARQISLNRLLLETDAPFMAPMPHRGKTCHSGYVPYTAKKIAELKNITIEEVINQTRENTRNMYGI